MKPLLEQLSESAPEFEFFELVRLLEHALSCQVDLLDRDTRPKIAFAHVPELVFPARDVAWVELGGEEVRVGTTFLGLLGAASPLAPEWSEQVLHSDDEGALRDFYDVFHHRALSLLVGAYKALALEGGFDVEGDDPMSKRLRSLAGVDAWAPEGEDALSPMTALGLADHQRGQPQAIDVASAELLLRRLAPAWNVHLEPIVSRFVRFTPGERARLGEARCRLGESLVYGDGCEDRGGLVRIHIGPVDHKTCEGLMPGGEHYAWLRSAVEWILAGVVDVELEVHLRAQDAPRLALGRKPGARLGVDALYASEPAANVRVRVPVVDDPAARRRTLVT